MLTDCVNIIASSVSISPYDEEEEEEMTEKDSQVYY